MVEKELSMFISRPVWLDPREGCWFGGVERGEETIGVTGEKDVDQSDRQGLVV